MARAKRFQDWSDPPPVSLVSGTEDYLVHLQVRKARFAASKTGRSIERVGDTGALGDARSAVDMFPDPVLLIAEGPDLLDADEVALHAKGKDNTVALLIVCAGELPKNKESKAVLDAVPKTYRSSFVKPPPWEAKGASVKFLQAEMSLYGKTMGEALASAMVSKVGTSLGVLRFEALKLAMYMDFQGECTDVTLEHVRGTITYTGEENIGAIMDALSKGSERAVITALDDLRRNTPGDLTLKVLAWLNKSVTGWLHAAALDAQGASESEGVSRTGMKPYRYKNFVLPTARRWGTSRLMSLTQKLPQIEASVKKGHVSPWVQLECTLIAACRGVASGR